MNASRLFTTADGRNHFVTFALVTSLFFLWGFCNGMIDVMDKHFQEELGLTLAQSAWVQFAHYLGYFLMALPAGWLAMRLGYKGGIVAGLLMVAVGGLWFIPATQIAQFWAFLLGVCIIAAGLTFLENRCQSIHHRARSARLCGNPHQLGPILQWYRVGVWTDGGRHVFLWHRPHRGEHGCGDIVDSLRGGRRRCSAAGRDLCAREVARHHAGRGRSGLIGRSQRNCLSRCAPRTRRCLGLAPGSTCSSSRSHWA